MAGDDSSKFSISSGGQLTFRTQPDYESPADADGDGTYILVVTANDGVATKTKSVEVEVTNANEPPSFSESSTTRSVPETRRRMGTWAARLRLTTRTGIR